MTSSPDERLPGRRSVSPAEDYDDSIDITWSELADAAYLTAWFEATEPQRDWEALPTVLPRRTADASNAGIAARFPSTSPATPDPVKADPRKARSTEPESAEATSLPAPSAGPTGDRPYRLASGGRTVGAHTGDELPQVGEPAVGLPGQLALASALRPLRLSHPSPVTRHLDEEATALHAAASGLWLALCVPDDERLMDLTVLVDHGPSRPVWRQVADDLSAMFEHSGAFRRIETRDWDMSAHGAELRRTEVPERTRGSTAVEGRSVVIVVTDAGSAGWRDGRAAVALHHLAHHAHVAVISVLPQQLWDMTLPSVARATLRPSRTVAPNRNLHVLHRARPWATEPDTVPIPVLELRPTSLKRWATMVASDCGRHEMGVMLTGPDGDRGQSGDVDVVEQSGVLDAQAGLSARERVARFRALASPAAFSLACHLAAAPLNMPVMRLLQAVHPKAKWWDLAEILLFGIVVPVDSDVETPDRVSFDFPDTVRQELLGLGTRLDTARVLRDVEEYLAPRLASRHRGGASLVAWQPLAALPQLNEETARFARPVQIALSVLAGPYLERANGLEMALASVSNPGRRPGRDGPRAAESAQRDETASVRPVTESGGDPGATGVRPPASELPPPPTRDGVQSAPASSPEVLPAPSAAAGPSALPGGLVSVDQRPQSDSLPLKTLPPKLWGNVPQRNRNFTGRGELLEQLMQRLAVNEVAAVLPEAIHGMGGVGKSQIAIEYAYRHGKDYGLVWWIPAEQNNKIIQSLIELGDRMGLRAGPEATAVRTVLDALQAGYPYGNWLLVFDNAENPIEVAKFFPTSGPGRIIVTSRNSQWSTTASSLEVNVFSREESVALLRRRSPDIPDDAADRLATSLGDLPLAVEQAAVWLAETGMPVRQYLELFDQKCAEILRVAPPPDYEVPVAAAWNVSLERLRQEHPAALQLLQVCAFFAPEPIPWDWFSAVRNVKVPLALQAALDDPIKLGKAVREIGRYALARIDHRQNTIQLHRLVQRVLVEQMTPQEQAQMKHGAHELLVHADPGNPYLPPRWTRYSDLLPHVHSTGAAKCDDAWTRRLVLNEVRFLLARGDFAACKDFTGQVRTRWREQLGRDHEDTLAADQVYAEVLRQLGEYEEAYRLQSDLVDRFRRVLGERHEDTQLALTRVAIHLRLRGDFYAARDMDQQAFETSQREFGPDEPNTLQAAHNYAVSLRLTGDAQQAYERDEDTWQRRVEVIGEDHVYTLGTLNSSYVDLQELGRYVEALEGQEQLAARARLLLGEDHPSTVLFLRELSVTRRKVGDHQGAFELSSKLLPVVRARYGSESNEAMRTALNHATDLRQTGDLEAARILGKEVMEQCRRTLGVSHPHTYATCTNLAVTLRLLGRIEEARALDEEAVEGLKQVLRPEHPRTLLARTNLASDLFAFGQPNEALEMDKETAELSARIRNDQHPATLAVRLNLSFDLTALGRTEEAQALYQPTMSAFISNLGADHPATRDAQSGLRANCDIDLLNV
ncbi:FxSxx-COOH system tetratricopeptide repeat protein [Streptomyces phaeochromogenes]|uniref:FxSxx-COOH system tetratricopeptide repeat protein n=1 Tax=Streptomyces phaeochromogenes TaxID=1923 RepID=UPI0034055A64